MKNIYNLLVIFFLTILSSCSNDFIEEKKQITLPNSKALEYISSGVTEDSFLLSGMANESYVVREYPSWLKIQSLVGTISEEELVSFSYTIDSNLLPNSSYGEIAQGNIIIEVKNTMYSQHIILFRTGNPSASFSTDKITFGRKEIQKQITIYNNQNNSTLVWEIQAKPDWLEVYPMSGQLQGSNYASTSIDLTCNRTGLNDETYTGDLTFKSNDKSKPTYTIQITMKSGNMVNADTTIPIVGIVKSSKYSKDLDKLYILTQQPNALYIYDTKDMQVEQITLPKAPTCFTLSKDSKFAYIGYSAQMSVVDISNKSISKNINLDFNVFDITYGENNRCYLSCTTNYFYGYYEVDTSNNNVYERMASDFYQNMNFLKIKDKPLVIATRTDITPSAIILLDISKKPSEVIKYWHEDFGSKLWQIENSDLIIGSRGIITKTPNQNTGSTIHELGYLRKNDSHFSNFDFIDYCANSNKFFAIKNTYFSDSQEIESYNGDGYNYINSYFTEEYVATINGIKDSYTTNPYYVFSNKVGNKLFAIKNIAPSYKVNNWSIEIIDIN